MNRKKDKVCPTLYIVYRKLKSHKIDFDFILATHLILYNSISALSVEA